MDRVDRTLDDPRPHPGGAVAFVRDGGEDERGRHRATQLLGDLLAVYQGVVVQALVRDRTYQAEPIRASAGAKIQLRR